MNSACTEGLFRTSCFSLSRLMLPGCRRLCIIWSNTVQMGTLSGIPAAAMVARLLRTPAMLLLRQRPVSRNQNHTIAISARCWQHHTQRCQRCRSWSLLVAARQRYFCSSQHRSRSTTHLRFYDREARRYATDERLFHFSPAAVMKPMLLQLQNRL